MCRVFKEERKLARDFRLGREYPNSCSRGNTYSVTQSLPCRMGALPDVADTQVEVLQEAEISVKRRVLSNDNSVDYA